ncbi:MAG: hypothetical protein Tp1100DCM1099271_10 [Prokaryotic dsDNA virus sp.]|nr:MAG: hypothetical protein Tp1102SUR405181_41 [Prokaryotic dsDNA virus sp.]QDP60038.1 MAG: hypothetical protein Tp1100DCM1099271_10 [Prokaryotic dsDNA virus sp.]QDP67106.1 MAG: hypothetical protein Tp1111SUR49671_26 [Prokaryotic dsDNA virus sp.]|tara:strand:+ start:3453 stop:3818 length:366 start_codon:yes stop_codon:yes gene_type:complete
MVVDISYLAAPYSLGGISTEYDRMQRYAMITRQAWLLFKQGINIYSPVTLHHTIQRYGRIDLTTRQWMKYDCAYLQHCKDMYVLMLDDWEVSTGVLAEIDYAKENHIPLLFIEPNEFVLNG